jgi:hypothetical protein
MTTTIKNNNFVDKINKLRHYNIVNNNVWHQMIAVVGGRPLVNLDVSARLAVNLRRLPMRPTVISCKNGVFKEQ